MPPACRKTNDSERVVPCTSPSQIRDAWPRCSTSQSLATIDKIELVDRDVPGPGKSARYRRVAEQKADLGVLGEGMREVMRIWEVRRMRRRVYQCASQHVIMCRLPPSIKRRNHFYTDANGWCQRHFLCLSLDYYTPMHSCFEHTPASQQLAFRNRCIIYPNN